MGIIKLRIPIFILLAVVVVGIFVGKYTINLSGMVISYNYRDLLFNTNGNTHFHAIAGAWLLLICSILSMILVWIKSEKAAVTAAVLCFIPPVWYIIRILLFVGKNPFIFDDFWSLLFFAVPLIAGLFFLLLAHTGGKIGVIADKRK